MDDPTTKQIDPLIRTIREHRVVLDADLAQLYGVSTKALNQAVKRNSERFPADFAFQLDWSEFDDLRSQIVISSPQVSEWMGKSGNRSQIVTGSQKHRDKRSLPWAFTEHGALMAANILRSERAVQMSVFVVRAFIRLRVDRQDTAAARRSAARCLSQAPAAASTSGRSTQAPHRFPPR
jgi:hypothetical protein